MTTATGHWTDEETALLGKLLADQVNLSEICAKLGRTLKSIETRASRMGWRLKMGDPRRGGERLKPKRERVRTIDWSAQQVAYLADAWPKGVPTPLILEKINRMAGVKATTESLLGKAHRMGLRRPAFRSNPNQPREPKSVAIIPAPLAPIMTRDLSPSVVRGLETGIFDGRVDADATTVVEWAARHRIVPHTGEDRGMWLARVNEVRRRYGLPGYRVSWPRPATSGSSMGARV